MIGGGFSACLPVKEDARFSSRALRTLKAPEDYWVVNRFFVYIQLFFFIERSLGRKDGMAHGFGGRAELRETLGEPDGSLSTILAVFRMAGDARNRDEF